MPVRLTMHVYDLQTIGGAILSSIRQQSHGSYGGSVAIGRKHPIVSCMNSIDTMRCSTLWCGWELGGSKHVTW